MPKLGLLSCETRPSNNGQPCPSSDVALVNMMEECDPGFWQYCVYRCSSGDVPLAGDHCDAWIISGSRASVYDDEPWIARLKQCVQHLASQKVPMVGICFGHQLLHAALGGQVVKAPQGWGVGAYPIVARSRLANFCAGDTIRLLSLHQDQVASTAEGFALLAGSDFCPAGITRKDAILTMQGHPELNEADFLAFWKRERRYIGELRAQRALEHLGQPDDRQQVRRFLANFLRTGCMEASSWH
ncbi:MAG: type 1 glutamine amidotransferase [Kistimonas sp.]|nr:type 1 glutamine amidotransferase [Kistimonas sp.]